MKIEQKLQKRINAIIQLTGDYPKEIEITQEEYNELASVFDKLKVDQKFN